MVWFISGYSISLKWARAKYLGTIIKCCLTVLALRSPNHEFIIVMENLNYSIYQSNSNWQFDCNCAALRVSHVVPSESSSYIFSCTPHPSSPQPKPHPSLRLLHLLIYPPFNTQLWACGTPSVDDRPTSHRLGEDVLNCFIVAAYRDLKLNKYNHIVTWVH